MVSAEHASLYYDGQVWKVRDLGSRNGTFLNGRRLASQQPEPLAAGDELSFGSPAAPGWQLESSRPPGPTALALPSTVVEGDGGILWLPSAHAPEACIAHRAGQWTFENADGVRVVEHQESVTVNGERYQLELPDWQADDAIGLVSSTVDAKAAQCLELHFGVSLDQEHTELVVVAAGARIPLGARAHNFTLLCLAKRRLAERHGGIPEAECGWIYAQELRQLLGLDREALNLQLWRATQALKKAGLPAEILIERRLDSQQLRMGLEALHVRGD